VKLPPRPVIPRHLRRVTAELPGGGRLEDCEFVESYRVDGFEGEVSHVLARWMRGCNGVGLCVDLYVE
jgi:hypothetical protein